MPILGALLAGCGTSPVAEPLLLDGAKPVGYSADLSACKSIALGYRQEDLQDAALGGALLGGVIGALDNEDDQLAGAIVGAALGGAVGAIGTDSNLQDTRRGIILRCMQGRGYRVLA